jgi:hypothetical protein
MNDQAENTATAELRSPEQRRVPPDRGIVLLEAKGRVGPKIWALYGKVDQPVILKDDKFVDNRYNEFYRDNQGRAFLLLPLIAPDDAERYELADAAYRRAVGLGVTENAMIFFTCVYQFDIPDYCCIAIHSATGQDVLEEDKCHTLLRFEQARLGERMGTTEFLVEVGKKVKPVAIQSDVPASANLDFAANMLVLHHQYTAVELQQLWDQAGFRLT